MVGRRASCLCYNGGGGGEAGGRCWDQGMFRGYVSGVCELLYLQFQGYVTGYVSQVCNPCALLKPGPPKKHKVSFGSEQSIGRASDVLGVCSRVLRFGRRRAPSDEDLGLGGQGPKPQELNASDVRSGLAFRV